MRFPDSVLRATIDPVDGLLRPRDQDSISSDIYSGFYHLEKSAVGMNCLFTGVSIVSLEMMNFKL